MVSVQDQEQEPIENFRASPDPEPDSDPEPEPDGDPTSPIGRGRRRNGARHDPQTAFGEEIVNVEEETELYEAVKAWHETQQASREHGAASRSIKNGLTRLKKFDDKTHQVRIGEFLVVINPNDREPKAISFVREAGHSMKITKPE